MATARSFRKVASLRYGESDTWCDEDGEYSSNGLQGTAAFFFHVKRKDPDGRFVELRCKAYQDYVGRCSVTAKVVPTGEVLKFPGVHNHEPDADGYGIEYRTAKKDMIADIRENPRKLPTEVILEHRRKLETGPASQIVPVEQARTMRYHASQVRPGRVKSLSELHEKISSANIRGYTSTQDNQRLLSFYSPQHYLLVLTTANLLRLLNQATVVHADATYKIVPRKLCKQLFTIHGNWGGHVGMVACALMNGHAAEAYRWVLQCLRVNSPGLDIRAYMGDWDAAMRSAIRSEYPNADLYGCTFHYSQNLVKKASSRRIGMAKEIRRPGPILSAFLALSALPLLPAPLIEAAFLYFAEEARNLHTGFIPFLDYVWSYWLVKIGPEDLSVYRLQSRTNNDVESNNAKLKRKAGNHGPVWTLMAVLVDLAQDTLVDFKIHQRGVENIRSRPSKATKANRLRVDRSWDLLDTGAIDDIQFINQVKYKVGKRNHLPNLTGTEPTDPSLLAWLNDLNVQNGYTSDSSDSDSDEDSDSGGVPDFLGYPFDSDDESYSTDTASESESYNLTEDHQAHEAEGLAEEDLDSMSVEAQHDSDNDSESTDTASERGSENLAVEAYLAQLGDGNGETGSDSVNFGARVNSDVESDTTDTASEGASDEIGDMDWTPTFRRGNPISAAAQFKAYDPSESTDTDSELP